MSSQAKEVRLRHAQRLARLALLPAERQLVEATEPGLDRGPAARQARSAALVAAETQVYGMRLEQARALAVALENGAPRLARACALWCDARRGGGKAALLQAALFELDACLGKSFGGGECVARCALLEPGSTSVVVVTCGEGSKTYDRGDAAVSALFRSADKSCVLEERLKDEGLLRAPFIVAPLRREVGAAIGCLAVSGLCAAAVALDRGNDVAALEDDEDFALPPDAWEDAAFEDRLKPFLRVEKDPDACRRVKLWRLRPTRNGLASGRAPPKVAARVVCGQVVDSHRVKDRRGFATIFEVHWEDGLRETDLSLRAIKELLRVTPRRLGVGAPLDAAVRQFIEYAAVTIARHVLRLRLAVSAKRVGDAVHSSKFKTKADNVHGRAEVYDAALSCALDCVLTARMAEVWAYDGEAITVVGRLGHGAAFRQMTAPRRLLEIPGHMRSVFWDPVHAVSKSFDVAFAMPFAPEIVVAPFERTGEAGLLLAVTRAPGSKDANDVDFCAALAHALANAMHFVRGRERRAAARHRALRHVAELCARCGLEPGDADRIGAEELEFQVLEQVEAGVAGCGARFASLQRGADQLLLRPRIAVGADDDGEEAAMGEEAAALVEAESSLALSLADEAVCEERSDGSSLFDVLPPHALRCLVVSDPALPPPLLEFKAGVRAEVRYGKVWFGGEITADRGHSNYDFLYDDLDWMGRPQKEAGVEAGRLRRPKIERPAALPAVVLDLANDAAKAYPAIFARLGKDRGVLALDSWAASSPEPGFDEVHVLAFVSDVASLYGDALDARQRGDAVRFLEGMTREGAPTRADVSRVALAQMRECCLWALDLRVVETAKIAFDAFFSAEGVEEHDALTIAADRCRDLGEIDADECFDAVERMTFRVDFPSSEPTDEAEATSNAFCSVFHDCTVEVDEKGVPTVVRGGLAVLARFDYGVVFSHDMRFCAKMAEVARDALACVTARAFRGLIRGNAFRTIFRAAAAHACGGPTRTSMQNRRSFDDDAITTSAAQQRHAAAEQSEAALYELVINQLTRVLLPHTSAVFGRFAPGCKILRCSDGTRQRRTPVSASFRTADGGVVCVAQQRDRDDGTVAMTPEEGEKGWPWVCAPLARARGRVLGHLRLQGFRAVPLDPQDLEHPDAGTVDLLEDVAVVIATALDDRAKADEMKVLHRLHGEGASIEDIYEKSLAALQRQLIRASRLDLVQLRRPLASRLDLVQLRRPADADAGGPAKPSLGLLLDVERIDRLRLAAGKRLLALISLNGAPVGETAAFAVEGGTCVFHGATASFALPLGEGWISSSLSIEFFLDEPRESLGKVELQGSYYLHLAASGRGYRLRNTDTRAASALVGVGLRLKSDMDASPSKDASPWEKQLESEGAPTDLDVLDVVRVCAANLEAAQYTCNIVCDGHGAAFGAATGRSRAPNFEGALSLFDGEAASTSLWDREVTIELAGTVRGEDVLYKATLRHSAALLHSPRGSKTVTLRLEASGSYFAKKPRGEEAAPTIDVEIRERPAHASAAAADDAAEASEEDTLEAYSLCVSDAARQAAKVSMQETRIALPCMALVVEAHRLRAPVVLSQGGDSLIIAPIEDLAVQIGDQLVGPLYGTRFAVVVRTRSAAAHDVRFAVDVSRSIEASVRYVRQRELRNSVRSQALRRVEAMAEEADQGAAAPGLDAAVLDLLNRGLHALSECLPGASAYVALLQPGGEDLHYVASNAQSSMVGRHLERSPEAVSFLSMDADRVFIADEGVHCFCEAQPLPFICVPLAYEGHSIGILGADTFEHVSKVHEAEGEPPEAGVLDLLRAAAAALARGVDSRRKAAALKRVSAAATAEAMVDAGLDTLCRNVPFATIAEIWEMTEERDFRCVAR
ncbi:hypothetical protein M885DRAFT_228691 [Pelagophyceae sp. CCMP2097]|nr:hypothetical protein M885DRAFT_228691 [Pelagophyceae sp. CCMP2097]